MRNMQLKCSDIPYLAGIFNHATGNEMVKILFASYLDGMFNHATMDETAKITDSICIFVMHGYV